MFSYESEQQAAKEHGSNHASEVSREAGEQGMTKMADADTAKIHGEHIKRRFRGAIQDGSSELDGLAEVRTREDLIEDALSPAAAERPQRPQRVRAAPPVRRQRRLRQRRQ